MKPDQIRFLYEYERWATRRVLSAAEGVDDETWRRTNVVAERGLGGILVHHYGAAVRWRIAFQSQGDDQGPEPEQEPLPAFDQLRGWWESEWAATDAWLATLTDDFPGYVFDGVPVWQMLIHVINHGTQHRSEAAALLSAAGHS